VEAADRAIALAPNTYVVDDPSLPIRTAAELKAELQKGIDKTWSDFNPARVLEPRK
jgi:hypothetical protein